MKCSNQWFAMKNFRVRSRSLNTISTWINRTKMLNREHITHLIALIIDIDDHYPFFYWTRSCWMSTNCEIDFILISNWLMRNFNIKLRRLFCWKNQLAKYEAQYRSYFLKKKIIYHLANENISAKRFIASSAESRELSFENVELSRKSAKTSSKDSVHRRLVDNVRVMISAVKRIIADEFYIITWRNKSMNNQKLHVLSEKMRIALRTLSEVKFIRFDWLH